MTNVGIPRLSGTEILILASLAEGEQYGLQIVDTVKNLTDGREHLSLGGLYTTLHRMERKGLVAGRWGETTDDRRGARRRYYQMTGVGQRSLAETRRVVTRIAFNPAMDGVQS